MFIGKIKCIFDKLIKVILANIFIADINLAIKLRKINVYPVWIFRPVLEKGCILKDPTIYRVLECVWIARAIKYSIFTFGKVDPVITGGFDSVVAVA